MAHQPVILVTGSNGQLGSELRDLSGRFPFLMIFLDRSSLPVDDQAAVEAAVRKYGPTHVINCAAYTAVDKAESERDAAFAINGFGTGYLAAAAKQIGARFLHISTDYVFDGTATAPLKEDHPVSPVNAYGESKLRGEELAMQHHPESIILRTSWVYSAHGKNFVKTMMRLMGERESVSVVSDQHGSPTYAADLAGAILQIIQKGKWVPGIYHYSNEGAISWFDFATAIRDLAGYDCRVQPIATEQFPTPARRPGYSVMDKTKFRNTFGIGLKDWKESLKVCLSRMRSV